MRLFKQPVAKAELANAFLPITMQKIQPPLTHHLSSYLIDTASHFSQELGTYKIIMFYNASESEFFIGLLQQRTLCLTKGSCDQTTELQSTTHAARSNEPCTPQLVV